MLLLPTLQWLATEKVESYTLVSIDSAPPPTAGSYAYYPAPDCTDELFANGNYSCTYNPSATAMDAWIQSYMSSQDAWNSVAPQHMVSFAFNSTMWVNANGSISGNLYWAPSRIMIRSLPECRLSGNPKHVIWHPKRRLCFPRVIRQLHPTQQHCPT